MYEKKNMDNGACSNIKDDICYQCGTNCKKKVVMDEATAKSLQDGS